MITLLYKRSALAFLAAACVFSTTDLQAQEKKLKKIKQEQIIIKKKGGKTEKTTIVVDGDNITINGKPANEYEGNDISIDLKDPELDLNFSYDSDLADVYTIRPDVPLPPLPPLPPIPPVPPVGPDIYFDDDAIALHGASKPVLGVYTEKSERGAKITNVVDDSPAQKAGLLKGDIITKIDGTSIADPSMLSSIISDKKPNDEIQVTYLRDNKEKKVKLKLGERKEAFTRSFNVNVPHFNQDFAREFKFNGERIFNARPKLGIRIQDTEDEKGVKVIELEDSSAAVKSGILKDDIITNIDGAEIKNTDEARVKMQEVKDKAAYQIKVLRNGSPITVDVKIPKKLKTTDL